MIVADTSTWIAFFEGKRGEDVEGLSLALEQSTLAMSPPVLAELLSSPHLSSEAASLLKQLPRLEIEDEFWERAANTRKALLKKGLKARTLDCLIAQNCIDTGATLIARDEDFRHFAAQCRLKLLTTKN